MTGRLDGRRGRGRPGMKFVDSLAKPLGGRYRPVELLQMTNARDGWRSTVANATSLGIRYLGKVMFSVD